MTAVPSVRGPIDSADLGTVLMHEHVFVLNPEMQNNYPEFPDPWNEEYRISDAVDQLTELKARGIDTIVDPTVWGLGRYLPRIVRINEQVDINIIPATGIYTYTYGQFHCHYHAPAPVLHHP